MQASAAIPAAAASASAEAAVAINPRAGMVNIGSGFNPKGPPSPESRSALLRLEQAGAALLARLRGDNGALQRALPAVGAGTDRSGLGEKEWLPTEGELDATTPCFFAKPKGCYVSPDGHEAKTGELLAHARELPC